MRANPTRPIRHAETPSPAAIEALCDQFTDFAATIFTGLPVDVLDRDDEVVVLANLPGRGTDSCDWRTSATARQ